MKAEVGDTVCITGVRPGAFEWSLGSVGTLVNIDAGDEDQPYGVNVSYQGSLTRVWCYRIKSAQRGLGLMMALDSAWGELEAATADERESARARLIDSQQAVCEYLGIRGPKW